MLNCPKHVTQFVSTRNCKNFLPGTTRQNLVLKSTAKARLKDCLELLLSELVFRSSRCESADACMPCHGLLPRPPAQGAAMAHEKVARLETQTPLSLESPHLFSLRV